MMNPLFGSAIRGVVENTLLEVSDRAVAHVMENHAEKLPFDDLFQGNLRKVIPLESKKLVGIKDKLTSFGLDVDIPNKKAFITKETQRGPKKSRDETWKGHWVFAKSFFTRNEGYNQ